MLESGASLRWDLHPFAGTVRLSALKSVLEQERRSIRPGHPAVSQTLQLSSDPVSQQPADWEQLVLLGAGNKVHGVGNSWLISSKTGQACSIPRGLTGAKMATECCPGKKTSFMCLAIASRRYQLGAGHLGTVMAKPLT